MRQSGYTFNHYHCIISLPGVSDLWSHSAMYEFYHELFLHSNGGLFRMRYIQFGLNLLWTFLYISVRLKPNVSSAWWYANTCFSYSGSDPENYQISFDNITPADADLCCHVPRKCGVVFHAMHVRVRLTANITICAVYILEAKKG